MANDVLAHAGDTNGNVVAKSESEGQAGSQVEERPVALPGFLTKVERDVVALNERLDNVLSVIMPDPREIERIELTELRRENKELKISMYVLCGLFFLLFLSARR